MTRLEQIAAVATILSAITGVAAFMLQKSNNESARHGFGVRDPRERGSIMATAPVASTASERKKHAGISKVQNGPTVGPLRGNEATLSGEWFSSDFAYAFNIKETTGLAAISNSPHFTSGDAILSIQELSGSTFKGKQMFSDGQWYEISGDVVDGHTMRLSGGGFNWSMSRR